MAHSDIQHLIEKIPEDFKSDQAGDLDVVLQFNLTGEKSGDYFVTIKDGSCSAAEGKADDPVTTFNADGQDWLDLLDGKADGMGLFMQGKLKIEGDMGIAMRVQTLFTK